MKDSDLGEVKVYRTNDAEDVDTYKDVLDVTYTKNENYTVTVDKGDFTIYTNTTDLTATAENVKKTYDGNAYGI